MWFDDLPAEASWTRLWSEYVLCGSCPGIRTLNELCPACGAELALDDREFVRLDDGREIPIMRAFAGAETRYEDYVYIQLLEREWERMQRDVRNGSNLAHVRNVSTGASIVLLFWTYFESRIEHLLRAGLRDIPPRFLKDALRRHSSISARLRDFYKVAFDSTYASDLAELGFTDVSDHLSVVQDRRNRFTHGDPQSIDDDLAVAVVRMLKREHESWIAVYNHRVASG